MDIRKILEAVDEENEVVLLKSFICEEEAVVEKDAELKEENGVLHIGIEMSRGTEFVPVEIFTSATVMTKMEFAMYAMRKEAEENAPVVINETNQL